MRTHAPPRRREKAYFCRTCIRIQILNDLAISHVFVRVTCSAFHVVSYLQLKQNSCLPTLLWSHFDLTHLSALFHSAMSAIERGQIQREFERLELDARQLAIDRRRFELQQRVAQLNNENNEVVNLTMENAEIRVTVESKSDTEKAQESTGQDDRAIEPLAAGMVKGANAEEPDDIQSAAQNLGQDQLTEEAVNVICECSSGFRATDSYKTGI
jgi:hypothetical protein